MYHVPSNFGASGNPFIVPYGFIANNFNAIPLGGKVFVEFGSCNLNRVVVF
jgi:hypothetical protein